MWRACLCWCFVRKRRGFSEVLSTFSDVGKCAWNQCDDVHFRLVFLLHVLVIYCTLVSMKMICSRDDCALWFLILCTFHFKPRHEFGQMCISEINVFEEKKEISIFYTLSLHSKEIINPVTVDTYVNLKGGGET